MVRLVLKGAHSRGTQPRPVVAHYRCAISSRCALCTKLHTCLPGISAHAKRPDCKFQIPSTYHTQWLKEQTIEGENETHQKFGITEKLMTKAKEYATCGFIGKLKTRWEHFTVIEIGPDGNAANTQSEKGTAVYNKWTTRGSTHKSFLQPVTTTSNEDHNHSGGFGGLLESLRDFPFIECTLNKKNVSHDSAMHIICQRIGISHADISVKKTMDKIGDTYQRIRINARGKLEMLLESASFFFPRFGLFLYDFTGVWRSFHSVDDANSRTLFEIILTDVRLSAPTSSSESAKSVISKRIDLWKRHGFLNYFGPQHFGWFRGKSDSSYHLLRGDFLTAAYQLLNFTKKRRPWIELLERPLLYPLSTQESLRKEMLKLLAQSTIGPEDFLDTERCARIEPDLNCTNDFHLWDEQISAHLSMDRSKIQSVTRESFQKMMVDQNSFQITTFQDYLWNQALSYIYQLFHVPERQTGCECPICSRSTECENHRSISTCLNSREDSSYRKHTKSVYLPPVPLVKPFLSKHRDSGKVISRCSLSRHFQSIYNAVSLKYGLNSPHEAPNDFKRIQPVPRKAVVHPTHVEHEYDEDNKELFLRFALPPGSFLTVAIHQLLDTIHVPYAHEVIRVPTDDILWQFGQHDENYIPTIRDIYPSVSPKSGDILEECTSDDITARIRDEKRGQNTDGDEEYRSEYLNMLDEHGKPAIPNFSVSEISRWSKTFQISNRERKRQKAEENLNDRLETDKHLIGVNPKLEDYCQHHIIPIRNGQGRAEMTKKVRSRDQKYVRLRKLDRRPTDHTLLNSQSFGDEMPHTGRAGANSQFQSIPTYTACTDRLIDDPDDAPHERRMRLKKGRGDSPLYYDINGSWWNRSYCRPFHPKKSQ